MTGGRTEVIEKSGCSPPSEGSIGLPAGWRWGATPEPLRSGDQGFFLGENGWFDTRWFYYDSMRQPLLLHRPKGIDSGTVSKQLVQNIDVALTVLDRAGAEGSDVSPRMDRPDDP